MEDVSPQDLSENRLLASLTAADRADVAKAARLEQMSRRDVLFEAGDEISRAYFPVAGMISLVTILADGVGVEMAVTGSEGMVGEPIFLGDTTWPNVRAVAQLDCDAITLAASDFRRLTARIPALHEIMQRFIRVRMSASAQEVACNRRHSLEQRCARWLLMTHDRARDDAFPLTQEFLAQMIGAHRPTVTEVVRNLQRAGAITWGRGRMQIDERRLLEEIACECYAVIRGEYERVLP